MADRASSATRTFVFKNRGALLALPALALVAFGKPSGRAVAVGLPLALAGEALRCWAVGYSGTTTRADHVTAPRLVTAGPYAHVRNPLYLGNFATAAGFALAFTGGLGRRRARLLQIASLVTMVGIYTAIVPLEEAYLLETFGEPFADYVDSVPRLIWKREPYERAQGTYDASVVAAAETRTFVWFGAMLLALALKAVRSGR